MNIRRLTVTATALALTGAGLLTTPAEAAGTIYVNFRDGRLSVTGNDTANTITVTRHSNGTIGVTANSTIVRSGRQATMANTRTIVVDARAGNDWVNLRGLLPATTTYLRAGDDRLYGSDGRDVVYGDVGRELIWGETGDDVLYGGPGPDTIQGGWGNDTLWGGDGNDELLGDVGNDTLRGETGDDQYVFSPWAADSDGNAGGLGTDLLVEASAQGTDTLQLTGMNDFTATLNSATIQEVTDGTSLRLSSVWSFENIGGSFGGDTLTGNALANRIIGRSGDDTMTGGGGADTFIPFAWEDDDTLTDFTAADTLDLFPGTTVSGLGTSQVTLRRLSGEGHEGTLTATNGHLFTADDFS